jgi:Fe-S oxidoreductase
MVLDADEQLLDRRGVEYRTLDAGCCGLAGAFGYERGQKYRISMACAERSLLPAIRQAAPETLLADGFSCRTQIESASARLTLHLAELLHFSYFGK